MEFKFEYESPPFRAIYSIIVESESVEQAEEDFHKVFPNALIRTIECIDE